MRLYLAGPISGMPDHNRPAFTIAATHLRRLGHTVFNPVEADDADNDITAGKPLAWFLRRDIPELCRCDAVAVLPGWIDSRGATVEVFVARALEMPVLDAESLKPIEPDILSTAHEAVYGSRRQAYGHPAINHARTAQMWSAYLNRTMEPIDVCLLNVLQKASRGANLIGLDTLVDIVGFALNADLIRRRRT